MRVFLNANILFSAATSDGAVRALGQLLLARGHTCWADAYVVAEARRNRLRKGAEASEVLESLLLRIEVVQAAPVTAIANRDLDWLPEKDRPVLAAAMRIGCDVLVTGDRAHFGPGYGRVFGGVTLHTPRSLAEQLGLGASPQA
jgi:predicted nucleic acid-binding protein